MLDGLVEYESLPSASAVIVEFHALQLQTIHAAGPDAVGVGLSILVGVGIAAGHRGEVAARFCREIMDGDIVERDILHLLRRVDLPVENNRLQGFRTVHVFDQDRVELAHGAFLVGLAVLEFEVDWAVATLYGEVPACDIVRAMMVVALDADRGNAIAGGHRAAFARIGVLVDGNILGHHIIDIRNRARADLERIAGGGQRAVADADVVAGEIADAGLQAKHSRRRLRCRNWRCEHERTLRCPCHRTSPAGY